MPKDVSAKTAWARKLKPQYFAIGLAIVLIAAVLFSQHHRSSVSYSACGPYRNDKAVSINSQKIDAEVVKTPADLQNGLSGRPCIMKNQGMLFVFDRPSHYAFWMKDMRFPIDIIWISSGHKVVGLEENVSPNTYPDKFVNKDSPAQYVLELQAGRSSSFNIQLGTPVNF